MKDRIELLGWMSSVAIIFFSGYWSFWFDLNFDNFFIESAYIPILILGVLLNLHFTKKDKKHQKEKK